MTSDVPTLDSPPVAARPFHWSRLVSAVLLLAIAMLAVVLGKAGREASTLRSELTQLRAKAGYLDVKDESTIYAVRLATDDPYEWAWRIHLPANQKYNLFDYSGRMPAAGLPHDTAWRGMRGTSYGGSSGSIESGDFVLRVRLEERANGDWQIKTITSTGWGSSGQQQKDNWLGRRDWEDASDVPSGGQREFPGQGAVQLLRLRHESTIDATDPNRITDTIVIWIADQNTMQQ